jgi:hypothetical protein
MLRVGSNKQGSLPLNVVYTSQGPAALQKLGLGLRVCVVDKLLDGQELSGFDVYLTPFSEYYQLMVNKGLGPLKCEDVKGMLHQLSLAEVIITADSEWGENFFCGACWHRDMLLSQGVKCTSVWSLERVIGLVPNSRIREVVVHTDSKVLTGCIPSLVSPNRSLVFKKQLERLGVPLKWVCYNNCGNKVHSDCVVTKQELFNEPVCSPPMVITPVESKAPLLSIVVVDDSEKPLKYLEYYLASMRELNSGGLSRTQLIVVSQRPDAQGAMKLVSQQPFPIDFVNARHEVVAGYPIWDVCDSLRRVWGLLKGQYLSVEHTEFFWCKNRLKKTVEFLRMKRPWIALGNLRRFGKNVKNWRAVRSDFGTSTAFEEVLGSKNWEAIAEAGENIPTSHWVWFGREPDYNSVVWEEDQFFVSKRWLEAIHFLDLAKRQAFQDVYDLLGAAWNELNHRGLAPNCIRLPLEVHKSLHLRHDQLWGSWKPAIKEWFLAHRRDWEGTRYLDPITWECLFEARNIMEMDTAVCGLRQEEEGTVYRFRQDLAKWLDNGRAAELRRFYDVEQSKMGSDAAW